MRTNFHLRSVALALAFLWAGCFNSSSEGASNVPGTGKAGLYLESVEWGRLVDVFDSAGALVERDVVIREGLQSDGVSYTLGLNPLTQAETLTILQPAGSELFRSLLVAAQSGRVAVATKGLDSPGPFSRVARNGALRIQFSELVDPATVDRQTVQVLVGNPPAKSQEVRYVVKNGEIGADGSPKGVIILDPTISRFDSEQLGIPENAVGYPASLDQENPNLEIRIPTVVEPLYGQNMVLTNLKGTKALGPTKSDPVELSPTFKPIVVRAVRTGNPNDPYNGFMLDQQRPKLITEQAVEIARVDPVVGNAPLRTLTYRIAAARCRAIVPKVGDLFEVGDALLVVTRVDDSADPEAYVVTGAVLAGDLPVGGVRPGFLTTAYKSADGELQLCWLAFAPAPEELPARGLDPYSTSITVRFDEPIDPVTVKSLETMVLSSFIFTNDPDDPARPFQPGSESVGDYIDRQLGYTYDPANPDDTGSGRIKFGPIEVSADSRSFTLAPLAGLADSHLEGDNPVTGLKLCLALRDGPEGILDLAGNPVDFGGFVAGNLEDQLDPGERIGLSGPASSWPTERYFALRFNATDENADGLSEYAGQYSFRQGWLGGRDLNRFSRVADPSNPYIGQRIAFGQGIMTPLVPAGAVLMTVYGYHHLGLGLLAVAEYNLDVEGLNWAAFGGSVFDFIYDRYSIALAHSKYFPDDYIEPTTGYPKYPQSGLRTGEPFDKNILGFPEGLADEAIVFDTQYRISSIALFSASTGTTMMPWPDFDRTYTWRDTGLPRTLTGGQGGGGVPPWVVDPQANKVYAAGQVPSIGLPLLMRFRCYPEGAFFGANGFQVQIMVGSSALPAFRVFSAGGRDANGTWHYVIPDVPDAGTTPVGGYNTSTGQPTKAFGPELYWGQVDFVVKVSRVYTHIFRFGGELSFISPLTMEPPPERLPPGTSVQIQFRGYTVVDLAYCGSQPNALTDAVTCFDSYADYIDYLISNPCCGLVSVPYAWVTDPTSLMNFTPVPQYFQIRLSFVANDVQGFEPELDALGFAWNVTE